MIRLNVFIKVGQGKREALLAAARELTEASLKDAGCMGYDIFESSTRPDVLMICETWKDDESLSVHQQAPHFVRLVPEMESMSEMKIEKFSF